MGVRVCTVGRERLLVSELYRLESILQVLTSISPPTAVYMFEGLEG